MVDINIVQNTIPFFILLIEGIAAIFVYLVSIPIYQKYRKSKTSEILYLFLSFFVFAVSITATLVGNYLDFTSSQSRLQFSYTDFFLLAFYMLFSIASIFMAIFYSGIFIENVGWRHLTRILFVFLNGSTIGIFWVEISNGFNYGEINSQFFPLLYQFSVTFTLYGLLIFNALKIYTTSSEGVSKFGSLMMILHAVFLLLGLASFGVDFSILSQTQFTVFYDLGWIMFILSALFGYLGYAMPSWLKNRLQS